MLKNSPFHITVSTIIEKNQQFLLVREHISDQLVYNQPSGHLEQNESLLNAAIRETLEETCWHSKPYAIVGIYLYQANSEHTFLRVCFASHLLQQTSSIMQDSDIESVHWLTYPQIMEKADKMRSPMVIQCIDDYLAGKRYPLDLLNQVITNDQ